MNLQGEWCLLQNQFDSYEKYSLIIKLFSVTVLVTTLQISSVSVLIIIVLLTLWLQDAIWKTFQARIETRLLQIESLITNSAASIEAVEAACQFNSEYQKQRPGSTGLVMEYFRQALRPTVAFPHVVLVILACYGLITHWLCVAVLLSTAHTPDGVRW